MTEEEYELFKKMWLTKFRGYYQKGRVKKSDLKASIFNNPKLMGKYKENFWKLVSRTHK